MKIITKLACLSLLLICFTACGDSASKDLAKETDDPNDYSFYIVGDKIEVLKENHLISNT